MLLLTLTVAKFDKKKILLGYSRYEIKTEFFEHRFSDQCSL